MNKLLIAIILAVFSLACFASEGRNQGAVNNLCQNLTAACQGGDKASCDAFTSTGCTCIESEGTCSRGNFSN